MPPFYKVCTTGNINEDLEIDVLKDPCDFEEEDIKEYDPDEDL